MKYPLTIPSRTHLILLCSGVLFIGTVPLKAQQITQFKESSWVGNTWGGTYNGAASTLPARKGSMQMRVEAMGVSPDGTVFTNSTWDESHKLVGSYKSNGSGGALDLGQFYEATSPSGQPQWIWLHPDGAAVCADSTYVFMTVNSNGNAKEPGYFRRYKRSDYRPSGDDIKVSTARLLGITVDETRDRVYVSDDAGSRVVAYDRGTLGLVQSFGVARPRALTIDRYGNVWVLQAPANSTDVYRVLKFAQSGFALQRTFKLGAGVVAKGIAIDRWTSSDATDRLLVADAGSDQQVKIYTGLVGSDGAVVDKTVPDGTFGAKNGIYSGTRGQYAPLKFRDLSGVAVDSTRNIYVSELGNPNAGTSIQAYNVSGTRLWESHNLIFVDMAIPDPGSETDVYSGWKHMKLDYNQAKGAEWKYAGHTVDPGLYPEDPRLNVPDWCYPIAIRRLSGKIFVYMSEMYGNWLAIFRADAATQGEILKPCAMISRGHLNIKNGTWPANQPATGEWIWTDGDGDGRFDASEFTVNGGQNAPGDAWGWNVDSNGHVWLGSKTAGIRKYSYLGLDASGNPRYDYTNSSITAMPAPFTEVRRVEYDAAKDRMFVMGYTAAYPNSQNSWGKTAGRVLACYESWSTGNRTAAWKVEGLVYQFSSVMHRDVTTGGMAIAGDYVFVQTSQVANGTDGSQGPRDTQYTHVYRAADGGYVGYLVPPSDASIDIAQIDIPFGLRVHQRSNGEYLIFVEDDWFGKVLMYRWSPVVSGSTYKLTARCSGKVADVQGVSTTDGANVHQWTWGGGSNQIWRFDDMGGGLWKITAKHSGKSMTVLNSGDADGVNVEQRTDSGATGQRWNLTRQAGGYFKVAPQSSTTRVLDVNGSSTADGANIQIWTTNNSSAQQWTITKVP